MSLFANTHEFCEAPIREGKDDYGRDTGPPTEPGWFLFQVVPIVSGGGSYFVGPAGQDHRIGAAGTKLIGIWAREKIT